MSLVTRSALFVLALALAFPVQVWADPSPAPRSPLLIREYDGKGGPVVALGLGPGGRQLSYGNAKGTLRVRDTKALEDGHASRPNAAVWMAYSPIVYTSYAYSGLPSLITLNAGGHIAALYTDSFEIQAESDGFGTIGALSTDGRVVAACFGDSDIALIKPDAYDRNSWTRPSWHPVFRHRSNQVPGGKVTALALDRDGEMIAVGYSLPDGGGAMVVSRRAKDEDISLQRFAGPATVVCYSPPGKVLATAFTTRDGKGALTLWEPDGLKRVADLEGTSSPVVCAAFSPDERVLATGLADGRLVLWDVRARKIAATVSAHQGSTNALSWGRDGRQVLSGGNDGYIRFWKNPLAH